MNSLRTTASKWKPARIIGIRQAGHWLPCSRRWNHEDGSAKCGSGDSLLTLAIETSCDDTCVAVLEKRRGGGGGAKLHFQKRVTADNSQYGGIHPTVAIESHSLNLASMVAEAVRALPPSPTSAARRIPDFISVTRGPGMLSPLATGLNTAKGLAVAWGVPLVAVNHMQAHALTPRLVGALARWDAAAPRGGRHEPAFPFLTLLVSGGHTMLVHSTALTAHRILARADSFAVGDALDKCARAILPPDADAPAGSYGPRLEAFAFPGGPADFAAVYAAPRRRCDEVATTPPARRDGRGGAHYPWALRPPMAETRDMRFELGGLHDAVLRLAAARAAEPGGLDEPERRALAVETMRLVFEHLGSRVLFALQRERDAARPAAALVLSGGVASNRFLRHVLRQMLDARGFADVALVAPPVELCTDNAAMIAWAGMEMFEAGWSTDLGVLPRRKWPLDPDVDGGILGTVEDGWIKDGERWGES